MRVHLLLAGDGSTFMFKMTDAAIVLDAQLKYIFISQLYVMCNLNNMTDKETRRLLEDWGLRCLIFTFKSNVESGNAILILRATLVLGVVNSGNLASEPRFLRFGEFRRRASVPRSYSGRAKNVRVSKIDQSVWRQRRKK